jgi:CarD family transcriptional regulator
MVFAIGDYIAHPLHGAGVIDSIEKQRLGGVERDYYVMRIQTGDILVKIPKDTSDAIGVRPVICAEEAQHLLDSISSLEISENANWNRRYRENMLKIRSGDLMEVASVIKSLSARAGDHGLSTGERKMLNAARQILLSELVLARSFSYEEAAAELERALH